MGGPKYLGGPKIFGGTLNPLANHVWWPTMIIAVYKWIVRCLNLVCHWKMAESYHFGWIWLSLAESGWVWLSPGWVRAESGWVWKMAESGLSPGESGWVRVNPGESGWVRAESGLSPGESGWVRVNPGEYGLNPLYITNDRNELKYAYSAKTNDFFSKTVQIPWF